MKEILQDLDKAFESKIRLAIMSALMVNDSLDFNALKELLDVTDGNLAGHLKYLEDKAYINHKKTFLQRKPNTSYMATQAGRQAFDKHIKALERLIQ